MAVFVHELREWLKSFKPDDFVWMDEGGLTMEGESTKFKTKGGKKKVTSLYLEIGGSDEGSEDEDE